MFLYSELFFCVGCPFVSQQPFAKMICFSDELLVIFCFYVSCLLFHLVFLYSELSFCVRCHFVSQQRFDVVFSYFDRLLAISYA